MNTTRPVTRKDVAQYAGVSETIVSYVINDNRYVAKEKKERVLDAIEKLHYRPNTVAQMLKGKKSNHLLFIADNISHEHFGKVVEEMGLYAYDKGYFISLVAHRNEDNFVAQVLSRPVDGIIINSGTFEDKYVRKLVDSGIPVVLVMSREYHDFPNVSRVYTGMKQGIRENVKLLVDKGRKNIIYVDRVSKKGHFSTPEDFRFGGFIKQMKYCGLEVTKENVITGYKTEDELFQGLKKKIQDGLVVDGVVGRNDNLACVAMSAILSCGLRVPEDVSILGLDNSRLSNYTTPKLTSVEIDRAGIGKAIIQVMEEMIDGGPPTTQYLDSKLVLRETL